MRARLFVLSGFLLFNIHAALAQKKAMTFSDASLVIKEYDQLDNIYQSAVHSDTQLAVFKSEEEQRNHIESYHSMLRDLGEFLKSNGFEWGGETRCFNRIYFNQDGKVDYFLFNFMSDSVPNNKEEEFARLLELFLENYTFGVTADTKFSQCSPVKYADR